MDQQTRDNWKKIKEQMDKSGNTNNMFYVRACKIVNGGIDPLDKMLNGN